MSSLCTRQALKSFVILQSMTEVTKRDGNVTNAPANRTILHQRCEIVKPQIYLRYGFWGYGEASIRRFPRRARKPPKFASRRLDALLAGDRVVISNVHIYTFHRVQIYGIFAFGLFVLIPPRIQRDSHSLRYINQNGWGLTARYLWILLILQLHDS